MRSTPSFDLRSVAKQNDGSHVTRGGVAEQAAFFINTNNENNKQGQKQQKELSEK